MIGETELLPLQILEELETAASPLETAAGRPWATRLALEAGIAALFLAFSIVMTWPLATGLAHRLASWGDPVFQAWTMAWDIHALGTNPLGIFDANIFYPYHNTLAYSDYLFGQAAVVAPILWLTHNAILADNVALLLSFAASGFAMYLLVLDLTGSRLAGIVAGFAYAFAPARMAHIEHLHLTSAEWLPLALLAARRALRETSWRWPIALGVVVLLQGLFGVYYFYFMLVLLGFFLGTYLLRHHSRSQLAPIVRMALCSAIAAALLLPVLLPYQRVHDELGAERTMTEVVQWSGSLDNYLAVSPRNRVLGEWLGLGSGHAPDIERQLAPGLLVLPLGFLGLFNRRLGWERWAFLAIALGSVVLSLGPVGQIRGHTLPFPYRILYDGVPGFRAIRVPARLGLLALVGLGPLVGLGVDLLLCKCRRLRLPTRLDTAALTLVPLVLVGGIAVEDSTRVPLPDPLPATLAQAQRPDYAWMAAHPAPTIEFPMGQGLIASSWPNFWSTLHWNPVVNGNSGISPPVYYPFRDRMDAFPSADTIRLLQGMGVRTVVYHSDPAVAPADDPFLQRAAQFPVLHQVVGGQDYVFTLDADPWMWQLAQAVPHGRPVDLPFLERDPPTFGMLAAILQRTGHTVYGQGTLGSWHLTPAPASVCYAIVPDSDATGTVAAQGGGLALIAKLGCK